ncbi:MAG: ABC transporter permease [Deltaproteobacteria bacterium]
MRFEWFIAIRYLREGKAQTALVLGGTTVGVAVLIFLTALISGLQRSLVSQTLSAQAHVLVKAPERVARPLPSDATTADHVEKVPDRIRSIEQWQQVLKALPAIPGVIAATPTAAGAAFASRGPATKSVALRGIDPESFAKVIDILPRMKSGRFALEGAEAIIGSTLASDLGVVVGDKIRITTPEGRGDVFTVAGTFDIGNKEVNARWVFIPLRSAQTMLDIPGGATTIEVKVDEIFEAERVAREIARRFGLGADSWMELNQQLLVGLRSQSASSWMIQGLVVLAVALGIASVLGVSVIQKSREIGILKATGTSTGAVQRIFLLEGALVGGAGSILGALIGSAMAIAFAGLARNPTGEPLFPVDLTPGLYLGASAVALLTGTLAAWFPARRAARLEPAEVIRYG